MRMIMLFLFFLLLNACSLNNPSLSGEIDKITVVKYTPHMKQHRAYFARSELQIIKDDKKYLYLYHAKENDLGILLHRKNQYILYSLSKPDQPALAMTENQKTTVRHVLKSFKGKGYNTITSLNSIGYISSVSLKRYKGVKTLLVETQEYSRLQDLYKSAIKTYNADKIKNIKTTLPKQLIVDYYKHYEKRATTDIQLEQLQIIAQKLQIKSKVIPDKTQKEKEESIQDELIQEESFIFIPVEKPYAYYLEEASLDELLSYIAQSATKNTLSNHRYTMLKRRETSLREEELFNQGSLEELIAAYKVNKDPKYKKRIMSLIKDTQDNP